MIDDLPTSRIRTLYLSFMQKARYLDFAQHCYEHRYHATSPPNHGTGYHCRIVEAVNVLVRALNLHVLNIARRPESKQASQQAGRRTALFAVLSRNFRI